VSQHAIEFLAQKYNFRLYPPVLWAQRKDLLYITVDLEDTENEEISLTEQKLTFK